MWRICGESTIRGVGTACVMKVISRIHETLPLSLGIVCMSIGDVKGQGDPHDEGREKKHRFPWVLQIPIRDAELVSSAFLDAEIQRLMGILETCVMITVSCKTRYKNSLFFWVIICLASPNLSSIRNSQGFQKSAGLKPLLPCLVICEPLPETCPFESHAIPQQEGIVRQSHRVLCLVDGNFQTASECTYSWDTLSSCVSRAGEI